MKNTLFPNSNSYCNTHLNKKEVIKSPQAIKHLKSLSALILATLLLAACGGGGGSSGGGGGASDPEGVITDPTGAIRGVFPDDGAVSYALSITRQNLASPILSLNATTAITGTCSISPAVAGLIYGLNNQTTASFAITFTGTATRGGSCVVNFAVNELTNLGVQTRNLVRTVTFNPEQAPTLVATLLGNVTGDSTNVLGNQDVRVSITATKQDGSNSRDVEFPAAIMSSSMPSCTATLAGRPNRQHNGIMAGTSSVSVTYNVSPTILGAIDNCGTFIFNATEGSVDGMSAPFSELISFVISDFDGDGLLGDADNCPLIANLDQSDFNSDGEGDVCDDSDNDTILDSVDNCPMIANQAQSDLDGAGVGDVCDNVNDNDGDGSVDASDVDADGDGLIELRTAAELNMMRNNLAGTGLDADNSDNNNNIGGNSTGCGNGGSITACNGYEQMADIDLNDLPKDATTRSNWEPVGFCTGMIGATAVSSLECAGNAFSGVFSGNNFKISNLLINITTTSYGVGFFGAISSIAQVLNVHIRGGNVTTAAGTLSHSVGGLVGNGQNAIISNSAVTLGEISGTLNVGGLIGDGDGVTISSSVAIVGSVSQSLSVATASHIGSTIGGLVGNGQNAIINSSIATVGSVSARFSAGGLVGIGQDAIISSSIATVGEITGIDLIGGLIGTGNGVAIDYSVAITNLVSGSQTDGFIGAFSPAGITASYWDNNASIISITPNGFGSAQTTAALQNPVANSDGNFPAGIYAEWDNAYCNPNTGEYRATAPSPLGDFIRVWDLGTSTQYPAITCARNLLPLDIQREASRRALAGELPLVD